MLPVDEIFSQLQSCLTSHNRVILQAPPGAGKSTRLPLLLLFSGLYSPQNQIVILEPRRVAARQIASYLSAQLNEPVGKTIGLSMRGENRISEQTVITIVTDGVMVRKLQSDPELPCVGLLIFDEFHERALQTDLALALSLDAQELIPELTLLIMSATIDLDALSQQLSAPVIRSEGRQFPVEIEYLPAGLTPSADEVVKAILHALSHHTSSVLVFLAGVADINKVSGLLKPHIDNQTDCFHLHGSLSLNEQNCAISPSPKGRRKVVLATNVAQTSLTIEDVDVVVDVGSEKLVYCQPKSGIEQLISQPISLASATQRAGRAGRLRPGYCYRLGSKENLERRRKFDVSEIERVNLAQLVLEVSLWGATIDQMFWLTKPDSGGIERAYQLLQSLGYLNKSDSKWKLTSLAKQCSEKGNDLRSFRMLSFASKLQAKQPEVEFVKTACFIAALLEERTLPQNGDMHAVFLRLTSSQMQTLVKSAKRVGHRFGIQTIARADLDESLIGLLLAMAFPDQIAKKSAKRWKLSGGSAVEFHSSEHEPNTQLVVVASINASKYGNYVGLFNSVNLDALQQHCPNLIVQQDELTWSDSKQKPTKMRQTRIGELVLNSTPVTVDLKPEEWQQLWVSYITQQGLNVLGWQDDKLIAFRNRLSLAQKYSRIESWPNAEESALIADLDNWLGHLLNEVKSLKQLKAINLEQALYSKLDWPKQQELSQLCPLKFVTPAGHARSIDYSSDTPKLSVKLQEMFGTPTNPAICDGKQPLLIELLSPAKRPLQVTQDLNNFWQNAYQEVKKEMKGRYPKHPWPDNPTEFQATTKVKSRL